MLSLVVGFVAAYKADRWYGAALSAFSQLFVAIPAFWVGILLIGVFSLRFRAFPAGGFPREGWSDPGAALTHLALPVLTVALVMAGSLSRYVRSATLDVLGSDYLRNARAMGSTTGKAMLHHGLRNGAVPVIAILGIELATAFLGAVVIEAVFALPGLGSMLLKAIAQHDYPNIGILFVSTLAVLIVGFIADVAQRVVDPRLRHGYGITVSMPSQPEAAADQLGVPPDGGRARKRRSVALIVGLVLVGTILLIALVSLLWLPYDPSDTTGSRLEGPSFSHWLGTDRLGHDLSTQIMVGARIALIVGLGAVAVGAAIGIPISGLGAAFAAGWLDDTLSAGMDILIAFPLLLLAMLVVAVTGSSLLTVTVAIGLSVSAIVARLTRVVSRRVLAQQYITAARTSGTGRLGIVWQHVLPNIWPTISVNLGLLFGVAVLAEASLSYLGLGAPPPNASWGRLLQEAQGTVNTAPLGAVAPGIVLVMLVIGVNLLVDGLRDVSDPTLVRAR